MLHGSVLKVFVITQKFDYYVPWQTYNSECGSGSALLLGPNQILTGAHAVANANLV